MGYAKAGPNQPDAQRANTDPLSARRLCDVPQHLRNAKARGIAILSHDAQGMQRHIRGHLSPLPEWRDLFQRTVEVKALVHAV